MTQSRAEEVLNSLGTLLLDDTGGLGESSTTKEGTVETYDFIVTLMHQATTEKLVIKCLYCQVLAATETHVLEQFLSVGGWDVINAWLSAALKAYDTDGHRHFLLELLKLLQTLPMNVNRLKENDTPKMLNLWLKEKKKKGGAEFPADIAQTANQVVKTWKDIVTKNNAPFVAAATSNGDAAKGSSKSSTSVKEKKRKSTDNSVEGGVKKTKSSSPASKSTTAKTALGVNKSNSSKIVADRNRATRLAAAAMAAKSASANVDDNAKDAVSPADVTKMLEERGKKKAMDGGAGAEGKPKVTTAKVKASKFRLDFTTSTTTTKAGAKKKKPVDAVKAADLKKVAPNGIKSTTKMDPPMGFMEALDAVAPLSAPSSLVNSLKAKLNRRNNKDSELGGVSGNNINNTTASTSSLSTTNKEVGLSQTDPMRDELLPIILPNHQELSIPSRLGTSSGVSDGGIVGGGDDDMLGQNSGLSTPVATDIGVNYGSSLTTSNSSSFGVVSVSSTTNSEEASKPSKPTISQPSAGFSFYKDILEETSVAKGGDAQENATTKADNEKMEVDDNEAENEEDRPGTPIMEDENEAAYEEPSPNEPAIRTALRNADGTPRSILKLTTSGVKKSVSWTDERKVRSLVEERTFELDATERVNVNRLNSNSLEAMKRSDAQHEKAMMDEQKHRPDVFSTWRLIPILVQVPEQACAVVHGCKSVERALQEERQKSTLESRFYSRLPDSPAEPELEFYGQREQCKVIPTEDEAAVAAAAAAAAAAEQGMALDPAVIGNGIPIQQNAPPSDYFANGSLVNGGVQQLPPPQLAPHVQQPPPQQPMHFGGQGERRFGDHPPHFGAHQETGGFNGGQPPMTNGGHFPPNNYNSHQGPPNNNNNGSFEPNNYNSNNNFGGPNAPAYSTGFSDGGFNQNSATSPPNMYNGPPPPTSNHQVPPGGYFNQPPHDGFNNNHNNISNGYNHNNNHWQGDGGPPPFGSFAPGQGGPRGFFRGRGRGGPHHFNKKGNNDVICRFWLNTGKCKFDERCNYSHHLPDGPKVNGRF